MKLIAIISVLLLVIISIGYYYNNMDLFQYRVVRVGWTKLYKLIDGLFNEHDEEENQNIHDIIKEFLESQERESNEEKEEEDDGPKCDSWISLSELVSLSYERIMKANKLIKENHKIVQDELYGPIDAIDFLAESYTKRLNSIVQRLPSFLKTSQAFFEYTNTTLNEINDGLQEIVKNAILKIDSDQVRTQKMVVLRLAKIQQQFEKVIQSGNVNHLECTCTVAKQFYTVTEYLVDQFDYCVKKTIHDCSNLVDNTHFLLTETLTMIFATATSALDKSESNVDGYYQLPLKVCISIDI